MEKETQSVVGLRLWQMLGGAAQAVITAPQEAEAGGEQGLPELQSELKFSLGSFTRPCLKIKIQNVGDAIWYT